MIARLQSHPLKRALRADKMTSRRWKPRCVFIYTLKL